MDNCGVKRKSSSGKTESSIPLKRMKQNDGTTNNKTDESKCTSNWASNMLRNAYSTGDIDDECTYFGQSDVY